VSAIEQGYVQREIQNAAYQYQLDIEEKRRVVVGQNDFISEAAPTPVMKIDPALEREQVARVRAWREARDAEACRAALSSVEAAARGDENLLPLLVHAVKSGATVGELSDVLRSVWGEHQESITL